MPTHNSNSSDNVDKLKQRIGELEAELKAARAERDHWQQTVYLTLMDLSPFVPPDRLRISVPSKQSIRDVIAELERELDDDSDAGGPVPV